MELAVEGRLSDPAVLDAQVTRMLADPRAEALGTRFAAQWLRLQDLEKINPDVRLQPDFYQQLRESMHRETELFFYNLVREDRSVFDLYRADYTFVDERLARHYGIPDVAGDHFRRVDYPDDRAEEGGGEHAIGSLDLLAEERVLPLFDTGVVELHGAGSTSSTTVVQAPNESFDLVIMNPPFTRPTNHEATDVPVPSFAGFSTSEDEQRVMSRRLRELRTGLVQPAGHGNAGLGSNFLDLADLKLRPGGTVALVLSAAFVQGKSWSAARRLLARKYRDLTVVSIATTGSTDSAFSSDTGMAEVLVLGTKRLRPQGPSSSSSLPRTPENTKTLFLTLRRRPRTILEAVTLVRTISRDQGSHWSRPDHDRPNHWNVRPDHACQWRRCVRRRVEPAPGAARAGRGETRTAPV